MRTEITYMEKGTYKRTTVKLNAKELCIFYQEKNYAEIISVKRIA
jgi:hypothetical protein